MNYRENSRTAVYIFGLQDSIDEWMIQLNPCRFLQNQAMHLFCLISLYSLYNEEKGRITSYNVCYTKLLRKSAICTSGEPVSSGVLP